MLEAYCSGGRPVEPEGHSVTSGGKAGTECETVPEDEVLEALAGAPKEG